MTKTHRSAGSTQVRTLPVDTATDPIVAFAGRYRFLSNFYQDNCRYTIEVGEYALSQRLPCLEVAYQASKCVDVGHARELMAACATGAAARRFGKRLNKIRPDWDQVRIATMRELIRQKFAEPLLALQLTATGSRELVEGNDWGDRFWGAVVTTKPASGVDNRIIAGVNWAGDNWLGKILMERRSALQQGAR